MTIDADNKDYEAGSYYVFDDRLEIPDSLKSQVEHAILGFDAHGRVTFAQSAGRVEVLTAEKKRKLDGSEYVLVRAATNFEIRQFFDDDDDEIEADVPVAGSRVDQVVINGPITRRDVHKVLAFFIEIEPNPDDVEDFDQYQALMKTHREQIEAGHRVLRAYAEQIEDKTLENMQEVFYSFTNAHRYLTSSLAISVVRGALSQSWHGVGPWRS